MIQLVESYFVCHIIDIKKCVINLDKTLLTIIHIIYICRNLIDFYFYLEF